MKRRRNHQHLKAKCSGMAGSGEKRKQRNVGGEAAISIRRISKSTWQSAQYHLAKWHQRNNSWQSAMA
jgi:hypothetical protein